MNPCDNDIFSKGEPVLLADARSKAMEAWVQSIAKAANARVDWHYSGGIAQMLHLGDSESRARVEAAIDELEPILEGDIMRRIPAGGSGIYRANVTQAPENAIAGFTDLDGETLYFLQEEEWDALTDIDREVQLMGIEIMWMTGHMGHNYSLVKLFSGVGYVLLRDELIIGAYNDETQAIDDYNCFDMEQED